MFMALDRLMLSELPLIFIQKPNLVSFLGVYAFLRFGLCWYLSVELPMVGASCSR